MGKKKNRYPKSQGIDEKSTSNQPGTWRTGQTQDKEQLKLNKYKKKTSVHVQEIRNWRGSWEERYRKVMIGAKSNVGGAIKGTQVCAQVNKGQDKQQVKPTGNMQYVFSSQTEN